MTHLYTIAPGTDDERTINIEPLDAPGDARRYRLTFNPGTEDAHTLDVDARHFESGAYNLLIDNHSHDIDVHQDADTFTLAIRGQSVQRRVLSARRLRMLKAGGKGLSDEGPELEAPMAGKVIEVSVQLGQEIEANTPVLIVEAMKMENVLKAHRSGTIEAIKVAPGEAVDVGQVLLTIV